MQIYLIRHGLAADRNEGTELRAAFDEDLRRPLTDEGRKKTKLAVQGMAALFPAPHQIIASGALRSVQTADIAASVWRCREVRSEPSLNPGADVDPYLEMLQRFHAGDDSAEEQRLAFVTHEPDLSRFLGHLLVGTILYQGRARGFEKTLTVASFPSIPLKKASLAVVGFANAVNAPGELRALLPPGVLRKIAKA